MSYVDLYCTRADVMRRLPPTAVGSPSAVAASSLAGSNVITLDGHGLETGDEVTVRAVEGGSLSAPLVEGTTYYAIRVNHASFKLAATAGGTAIDLTTNAVEMMVIREPSFDEHIQFYSRWADGILPGHLVPLTAPIHPVVAGVVADCVAKRVLNIGGQDSAVLNATELASKAILERHATGLVLRGAPVTASANLAVTTTLGTTADPRGWAPTGGTLP